MRGSGRSRANPVSGDVSVERSPCNRRAGLVMNGSVIGRCASREGGKMGTRFQPRKVCGARLILARPSVYADQRAERASSSCSACLFRFHHVSIWWKSPPNFAFLSASVMALHAATGAALTP